MRARGGPRPAAAIIISVIVIAPQVVPDHFDRHEHVLEVSRDRDLLDGVGKFSVFGPDAARTARIVYE